MAPAERRAEAEGDGGGRTTPDECESVGRLDGCDAASVEVPRGDADSAVALPPSEGSSGIWTLSRGLAGTAPPPIRKLFDRDGGVNVVSGIGAIWPSLLPRPCPSAGRCGAGGELVALFRGAFPGSAGCDLLVGSDFGGSGWKAARC